ncbi:hypothetical protein [Cohnella sp. GCM10012308]|uniref:hypothetical protein n=1 Tax=Cohnella sp. GCM10012308 TaxID=3317329 RepID=UPI0036207FE3
MRLLLWDYPAWNTMADGDLRRPLRESSAGFAIFGCSCENLFAALMPLFLYSLILVDLSDILI